MSNKILTLPFDLGRLIWAPNKADSAIVLSDQVFSTSLKAVHRDKHGRIIDVYDLGSGKVTNVGTLAMANDFGWAAPSGAAINILRSSNYHASGTTGAAAGSEAATDITLGTYSTHGGQTPVAGTQSAVITDSTTVKYQTSGTINYSGTETVTEWGLFNNGAASGSILTGTASAVTATTLTSTGFTASSSTVQGDSQYIVKTGTTTVWGLIASCSTTVLTLLANSTPTGWWTVAAGTAGSTPGNTETYTVMPVMWDHKIFTGIGVNNGDSIQFVYALTITPGG